MSDETPQAAPEHGDGDKRPPRPVRKFWIRHVRFTWQRNEYEAAMPDDKPWFQSGEPPIFEDECSYSGYEHYMAAERALYCLVLKAEEDPKNLIFLKWLAHGVVSALDYPGAPDKLGVRTEMLLAVAESVVGSLNRADEEVLIALAKKRSDWPCLVTLKDLKSPRVIKRLEEWDSLKIRLERLGLGAEAPLKNLSSVMPNRLARSMVATIEDNQRALRGRQRALEIKESDPVKFDTGFEILPFPDWAEKCGTLPALTEEGASKRWFEIGWEALLEATEGHPEQFRELWRIGKYRKDAYQQSVPTQRTAGRAETPRHIRPKGAKERSTERSNAANIRDGIKSKIRRAFMRLASSSREC
jgi:hypothetical protein